MQTIILGFYGSVSALPDQLYEGLGADPSMCMPEQRIPIPCDRRLGILSGLTTLGRIPRAALRPWTDLF